MFMDFSKSLTLLPLVLLMHYYGTVHTKGIQSDCDIIRLIKPIALLQQNAIQRNSAIGFCVCWLFAAVEPLAHSASLLHQ